MQSLEERKLKKSKDLEIFNKNSPFVHMLKSKRIYILQVSVAIHLQYLAGHTFFCDDLSWT